MIYWICQRGTFHIRYEYRTNKTYIRTIKIKKIINKINKLISKYDVRSEIVNNIKPFLNVNGKTNMSDFITGASFIDSKNKYILGVGSVNAHKKNEFITIDSVKKLEEQYKDLIERNI